MCLLNGKHQARFVEVLQEELTKAIPLLSREECEMVHPSFAISALVNDTLKRAFLERCAEVRAGLSFPGLAGAPAEKSEATPDIPSFQREREALQRRQKHISNVFTVEASVRKETFSFYASLPAEVRSYLDELKEGAMQLPAEECNLLTLQVAEVFSQLGLQYSLGKRVGSVAQHIVVQGTNPHTGEKERTYECSDMDAYYADKSDKDEPEFTAATKLRHRLLDRMGVHLTHINIWEWRRLSEAQRVNYLVKLHSFQ